MAQTFYDDEDTNLPLENEEEIDEEEAETLINAQETISAAIRLATSLFNRGKLNDVFLAHLRNSVLRITDVEEEDEGFDDTEEGEDNLGYQSAQEISDCPCGGTYIVSHPMSFSAQEGLSLSDSTRDYLDRELGRYSGTPSLRPGSLGTPLTHVSSAERQRTGILPRRLFPDSSGASSCNCDHSTPNLAAPISWTPSPARSPISSDTYNLESVYGEAPRTPRQPVEPWRLSADNSILGTPSLYPDSSFGRSRRNTMGSIAFASSPSGCPDESHARVNVTSSSGGGFGTPSLYPDSSFGRSRRNTMGSLAFASSPPGCPDESHSRVNVTSSSGRRSSGGSGRYDTSSASQFRPDSNSTNVSGNWGNRTRLSSACPMERSQVFEQSSGSIPSWRLNADRNAMAGGCEVHSWAGQPRTRSLSFAGRSRPASFEFVPSEDSSRAHSSWFSNASRSSPEASRLSTGQRNSQCQSCTQSADGSSLYMNTFGGFRSSPEYLPLRFRRNWSIAPAGAQPGELSWEESWRHL